MDAFILSPLQEALLQADICMESEAQAEPKSEHSLNVPLFIDLDTVRLRLPVLS